MFHDFFGQGKVINISDYHSDDQNNKDAQYYGYHYLVRL